LTLTQFLTQFPEFASTDLAMVQAILTAALLEIDASVWGPKADQGQAYLAAHKLALSPFGQQARMVAKDGSTTYEKHYKSLMGQVASGYRVA
jgi:hypothetical protein